MTPTSLRIVILVLAISLISADIIFAPRAAAAQGLLLALAIWTGFPIGSLVLRLIHGLTGGNWGRALQAPLRIGVRLMLLAVTAFALLSMLQRDIYSWMVAAPGGSDSRQLGFNLRGAAILLVWTGLGLTAYRPYIGPALGGLGLTAFAVTLSVGAVDWFQAVDPDRVDTSLGVVVGVQQLLTALCIGTLFLRRDVNRRVVADVAGLMMVCLLGLIYLDTMTFIIDWYGDLPKAAQWYLTRSTAAAQAAIWASAGCAFAALGYLVMYRQVRRKVQIAALVCLLGITAHWTWLLAPDFAQPIQACATAMVALIALILSSLALEPALLDIDRTADPVLSQRSIYLSGSSLDLQHPTTLAPTPAPHLLEPPDVANGRIFTIILGFAAFVAVSLGALRYYVDQSTPDIIGTLKRTSASRTLIIPRDQSLAAKAKQLARIGVTEADSGHRTLLTKAMDAIVARGPHAYDPITPSDVSEPQP